MVKHASFTAHIASKTFLLSLILVVTCLSVSAQCAAKKSDLPAAPELLGFRLGMTKEEVKVRVPQTVFGKTDRFGVSKTTINPYFDPKIDKTKFENVRSISLDLLDEHVTSIWIGFDENYKVAAVDEFVKLISESFHISAPWTDWKSRGRQVRCADFQLIVTTSLVVQAFDWWTLQLTTRLPLAGSPKKKSRKLSKQTRQIAKRSSPIGPQKPSTHPTAQQLRMSLTLTG